MFPYELLHPQVPTATDLHLVVYSYLRVQLAASLFTVCIQPQSDHKLTTSQQQISSALGFSFPPNCASIFWHGRGIRCLVMSHEYSRPREQCFHREREILGSKFVNWRNPERGSLLIIFHGKVAHQGINCGNILITL